MNGVIIFVLLTFNLAGQNIGESLLRLKIDDKTYEVVPNALTMSRTVHWSELLTDVRYTGKPADPFAKNLRLYENGCLIFEGRVDQFVLKSNNVMFVRASKYLPPSRAPYWQ